MSDVLAIKIKAKEINLAPPNTDVWFCLVQQRSSSSCSSPSGLGTAQTHARHMAPMAGFPHSAQHCTYKSPLLAEKDCIMASRWSKVVSFFRTAHPLSPNRWSMLSKVLSRCSEGHWMNIEEGEQTVHHAIHSWEKWELNLCLYACRYIHTSA